jgi:xylulokinase
MMSTPLLLGIDLGTSSVKVLAVDLAGRVRGAGAAEYPILHPEPLHAEQDPAAWWDACVTAVRAALAAAAAGATPGAPTAAVAAIGLSGQMHGVVMLDRSANVLAPAVIWPDQRSRREVEEITALVGPARLYAITGSPLSTGFLAATVRWFQTQRPALWAQVHTLLLPKDYIRFRLTGRFATDPSDAAGSLLLDERQRTWSAELLDLLAIDAARLPPVQPSASVAGGLTAAAAEALGLPAGIPVVTGAADTPCGLLGAGAVSSAGLLLSISTGGQLVQPVDEVRVDPLGRIHTFCTALDPAAGQAGWYQMGATLNAGMALRWLRDSVLSLEGPDAYAAMNAAAAASPPGAEGLLFLPYLVGERSPHMDPTARGAFFGLTLRHGRGDLVRAVLEGATFACYDAYGVLAELGVEAQSVILAGGGARSPLWRQIVADVFGLEVRPLLTGEQSALGAVLLAGGGAGLFDLVATARAWAQLGPVTAPDAARHAFYAQRFAAFQALYARNKGHFV